MKKLWRRASGKIKDRNSIIMASITLKTRHRNPGLEGSMIKATSHDDSFVNYKNAQRVFSWVTTSPSHLIIFLWALTRRIESTRDWVVALKSLILLHGVLCTKAPGTRKIGRLPFDLSWFEDGYIGNRPRRVARSAFVRAYFVFSDLKSATLSAELKDEMALPMMVEEKDGIKMELERVNRWQHLLHAALQVRPYGITDEVVILEAMDCMVIEVFELYSKICQGIATTLIKVYTNQVAKAEASITLDLLRKADKQAYELSDYFDFCQKIGLLHASECPQIQEIPKEDFLQLEKIIDASEQDCLSEAGLSGHKTDHHEQEMSNNNNNKPSLKTVITDKWEVFDEEISKVGNEEAFGAYSSNVTPAIQYLNNPFIDYVDRPSQHVLSLL